MAKTWQVMKIDVFGARYSVIFHNDVDTNPFWLYDNTGKHKRIIDKYANFESCLHYLMQMDIEEFKLDYFGR